MVEQAQQTGAPAGRVRYRGLDGLRGLAVAAVIIYHLDPGWLPGGFLGVDVFFVISGFLITSLLISEWEKDGAVRLGHFWARRARRLLPALIGLLLVVTLLAALFAPDAVQRLRGDLPASLLFVENWRLVFHHDSYVTATARPPLLLHTWSLAIEEQFYLLWPPLLVWLLKRRVARARIAAIALGGAAASSVLMALAFHAGGDPSSDYFATSSHCQGILIGCALGAALRPGAMIDAVAPRARRLLASGGLGVLAVATAMAFVLHFGSTLTYRGGMVLLDLAVAAVIVVAVHPACRFGPALDCSPLRWLGTRSYSLYLWHWPIFDLTRPGVDLAASGFPLLVLRVAATAAAAEASYRWIEQPWRTGRAQAALRSRLHAKALVRASVLTSGAVVTMVAVLVATISSPSAPAVLAEGATPAARVTQADFPPPPTTPTTTATTSTTPTTTATTSTSTSTSVPPASPAGHEPILAIGDSVLLAASPALNQSLGHGITIDAAVGRQAQTGLDRLAAYKASGQLSTYKTVLIDLGTNGPFTPQQMTTLTQLTESVPLVVLFTVSAPRSWIAESNSSIRAEVAQHPANMRLADWSAVVSPSLLYPDGIHPDPAGAETYTQLLLRLLT